MPQCQDASSARTPFTLPIFDNPHVDTSVVDDKASNSAQLSCQESSVLDILRNDNAIPKCGNNHRMLPGTPGHHY